MPTLHAHVPLPLYDPINFYSATSLCTEESTAAIPEPDRKGNTFKSKISDGQPDDSLKIE